jgi:hypothetical protein
MGVEGVLGNSDHGVVAATGFTSPLRRLRHRLHRRNRLHLILRTILEPQMRMRLRWKTNC